MSNKTGLAVCAPWPLQRTEPPRPGKGLSEGAQAYHGLPAQVSLPYPKSTNLACELSP